MPSGLPPNAPFLDTPLAQIRNIKTGIPGETNIMSYSGADYAFTMYVPVDAVTDHYWRVQEVEDEIIELEAILDEIEAQLSRIISNANSITAADLRAAELKRAQIETVISQLRAFQESMKAGVKNGTRPFVLDGLQTFSWQIHTDKQAVRALGSKYPKGYTSGQRLIAGSMIFTVVVEHSLMKIIDAFNTAYTGFGSGSNPIAPGLVTHSHSALPGAFSDISPSTAVVDQLPPFHLQILGVNEQGNAVTMTVYGIQFVNDGGVMSIQDILTEQNLTWVAQDIDIMRTLDTRGKLKIPAFSRAVTASKFTTSALGLARRARRASPF